MARPDAGSDADVSCSAGITYAPVAATGYTPAGPLDVFHYAQAYYDGCDQGYVVELTQTMTVASCTSDRSLLLEFAFPYDATQPGAGTFAALASELAFPTSLDSTTRITFEATQVDPPTAPAPRLVGRFISSAPGWSIDLPIDLHSPTGSLFCD